MRKLLATLLLLGVSNLGVSSVSFAAKKDDSSKGTRVAMADRSDERPGETEDIVSTRPSGGIPAPRTHFGADVGRTREISLLGGGAAMNAFAPFRGQTTDGGVGGGERIGSFGLTEIGARYDVDVTIAGGASKTLADGNLQPPDFRGGTFDATVAVNRIVADQEGRWFFAVGAGAQEHFDAIGTLVSGKNGCSMWQATSIGATARGRVWMSARSYLTATAFVSPGVGAGTWQLVQGTSSLTASGAVIAPVVGSGSLSASFKPSTHVALTAGFAGRAATWSFGGTHGHESAWGPVAGLQLAY